MKSKLQALVEEMMRRIRGERKGRPMADVFDLDKPSAEWALSTSMGNRTERPKHVSRLRVAMSGDDTWNFDGDALSWAIDEDGNPRLFEGHHRCEARILAGDFDPLVTITVGSRLIAQETRGDKQKWSPRDYSTARGLPPRCGEIASALLRATINHSNEVKGHHVQAVDDFCEDGFRLLGQLAGSHARLSHANVLAGILIAWPSNPAAVEEFATMYFAGTHGTEHPVGLLRQYATTNSSRTNLGPSYRVKFAWRAASAVSLYLRGEHRKQLKIEGSEVSRMLAKWAPLASSLDAELIDVAAYLRTHREADGKNSDE